MRCFTIYCYLATFGATIARLLSASGRPKGATGAIEIDCPVRFIDEKQNDAAKYHNYI
jgi:hypothetical protein